MNMTTNAAPIIQAAGQQFGFHWTTSEIMTAMVIAGGVMRYAHLEAARIAAGIRWIVAQGGIRPVLRKLIGQ